MSADRAWRRELSEIRRRGRELQLWLDRIGVVTTRAATSRRRLTPVIARTTGTGSTTPSARSRSASDLGDGRVVRRTFATKIRIL
jgi:hypothetical protein